LLPIIVGKKRVSDVMSVIQGQHQRFAVGSLTWGVFQQTDADYEILGALAFSFQKVSFRIKNIIIFQKVSFSTFFFFWFVFSDFNERPRILYGRNLVFTSKYSKPIFRFSFGFKIY